MPELVIDDEPAVMRFVAPLEYFNGLNTWLTVVFVTKPRDACSYSNGINLAENS